MIIVTGGAGFIGSALIWRLNQDGRRNIVIADEFDDTAKWQNIVKRQFNLALDKDELLDWLNKDENRTSVEAIFHLGACSSTSEKNTGYLLKNNVHYSMSLFNFCKHSGIPFIYASSAATYGNGEHGYKDTHKENDLLKPINPYGFSKKMFDSWVLQQSQCPPFWAGLKFFNVFGPGEYHKGSMASLVSKAVPQIQQTGSLKLFKSYKPGISHGEQKRDFVYVKDVVDVMLHLWELSKTKTDAQEYSGLYNVGTGQARSFHDLGKAVFDAMQLPYSFEWVDMPDSIKDGYQYYTEAEMSKLKEFANYQNSFTSMEAAVKEYVQEYLLTQDKHL